MQRNKEKLQKQFHKRYQDLTENKNEENKDMVVKDKKIPEKEKQKLFEYEKLLENV